MSANNIDWLLAYAADELHYQGVAPAHDDEPPNQQHGNCAAVADLMLEWNFGDKAWDGHFVRGPLTGTEKRIYVAHLNRVIWATLRQEDRVTDYWCRASLIDKKNAAKVLITMWGEAVVGDRLEEFETKFYLPDGVPETPPRGTKRPLALTDTAVAADDDPFTPLSPDDDDTAVAAVMPQDEGTELPS